MAGGQKAFEQTAALLLSNSAKMPPEHGYVVTWKTLAPVSSSTPHRSYAKNPAAIVIVGTFTKSQGPKNTIFIT